MYLLVCLAVLGAAFGVPLEPTSVTQDASTRNLPALYVLPTETFPTFYDVALFLDPSNEEYFFGNVSIRISTFVPTNEIYLHAMEMDIDNVEVYSERDGVTDLFYNFTTSDDDTHLLRIITTETLQPLQPYTVHINYVGRYAENMFGIYVSKYEENGSTQSLVTSQLQPTFARRAFPCYDEPAQKAIFRTTIYAPEAYAVVRSNTVLRNDTLKDNVAGWVKHEFEDTLVMSSYLLAYLVSNFEYIDNTENPLYHIPFRVYSRPGTNETARFALDFGQRNMVALENYTEFAYEFPKMDKVAVPDFAAALLVQDGVTTTAVRQNIGRIICHENVHQWFGNEVGPQSWTYTWLNEGFANFFENFATDLVLPEWRMMDQFVIALQNVFQSDAVLSVNPMTHEVYTPSQILGTFNAVAYQKSGSVIRMMQHFLTPEIFRQGLIIYIKENHHCEENSAQCQLCLRERYLTDTSLTSNDRWHIPVNWVLSTDIDFQDTSPQFWVGVGFPSPSIDIPGLQEAEWFIFNKQQTGYYRVNYDNENWEALAGVLSSDHSII
ncbi:Aminopeptidase N-7, partial [Operophtera brumata]